MSHPRDEVEATVARYVDLRERIESGASTWLDLAAFFTDDIVYIDPAWGRVQGIDAVREFLVESDCLNMAHVFEDLKASGWRPGPGFQMPPATPDRNFSVPDA